MTGNGNGLLVKILAPVAVMVIASLAANYALVNRLDERVKINEEHRKAQSSMVTDLALLNYRLGEITNEISELKSTVNPIGEQLKRLNENIEARRRESER